MWSDIARLKSVTRATTVPTALKNAARDVGTHVILCLECVAVTGGGLETSVPQRYVSSASLYHPVFTELEVDKLGLLFSNWCTSLCLFLNCQRSYSAFLNHELRECKHVVFQELFNYQQVFRHQNR